MFWSKIWFFLVAVVAAVAITVALVVPRPAQRQAALTEAKRVRRACDVASILLRDNARARIQLASEFSQAVRQLKLSDTLYEASKGEIISAEANATGRTELNKLLDNVSGTVPSFVLLLDRQGRVVARAGGKDDKRYGESLRGYYLVDDALGGYLRDDLWVQDGVLYRVAGAPVLTRQLDWAGAIVLGQAIDNDFVGALAENLDAHIGFYVADDPVASSDPASIHKEAATHAESLTALPSGHDCAESDLLVVTAGDTTYNAVTARLPGEAGALGAFYTVFIEQEQERGFMATLGAVKSNDLSFGEFPWIPVALIFLLVVGGGLALMIFETDRPLRHLNADAVALAQGNAERLTEERHRGKFGSIARSVNIAIDKLHREARSAKKDLDQLLGPAPDGGVATPLPPLGGAPLGPATPPPPSEFKFTGADPLGLSTPLPKPTPFDKTPPPVPATPPPVERPSSLERATNEAVPPKPVTLPKMGAAGGDKALDDDILGASDTNSGEEPPTQIFDGPRGPLQDAPTVKSEYGDDEGYFREIFEDFVALKKKNGEGVENLTFDRFAAKLRSNRDALIAKHGCKTVKFQVYAKDGRAALKASPVR